MVDSVSSRALEALKSQARIDRFEKAFPMSAGYDNPRQRWGANPFIQQMPTDLMQRPAFGKAGKAYKVNVNSFKVEAWPTRDIYQFDVSHLFSTLTARAHPNLRADHCRVWR